MLLAELSASLDALAGEGELQTEPFLAACRHTVPVIESLGAAFMPARADVTGNIERLAARVTASPGSTRLFSLVEAELAEGSAGSSRSCTKGLLWLKRFLEFTVRLLERLGREPEAELGVCASAAYAATLAPFHGYLTTALFTVVLHAVPSRASFERAIVARFQQPGTEPDSKALAVELGQFAARFTPVLARIHLYLADAGLCVTAAGSASSTPSYSLCRDDPTPV